MFLCDVTHVMIWWMTRCLINLCFDDQAWRAEAIFWIFFIFWTLNWLNYSFMDGSDFDLYNQGRQVYERGREKKLLSQYQYLVPLRAPKYATSSLLILWFLSRLLDSPFNGPLSTALMTIFIKPKVSAQGWL